MQRPDRILTMLVGGMAALMLLAFTGGVSLSQASEPASPAATKKEQSAKPSDPGKKHEGMGNDQEKKDEITTRSTGSESSGSISEKMMAERRGGPGIGRYGGPITRPPSPGRQGSR